MVRNTVFYFTKYLCPLSWLILTVIAHAIPLNHISYKAASVLPTWFVNDTLYVVLSREAYGSDKGTYDAFGGSRDPHEHNPLITAARECAEEMISHLTIDLSPDALVTYLDPTYDATNMVLVNEAIRYVLFITNFEHFMPAFIARFYTALQIATEFKYQEKDSIALVPWDTLETAVRNHETTVCATVFNRYEPSREECTFITLRPILSTMMELLFSDAPYYTPEHEKIRIYPQKGKRYWYQYLGFR